MAIYVKDSMSLKMGKGTDFLLYADTSAEFNSSELETENFGNVKCQPGSKAYTGDGKVLILLSTGVWAVQ